MSMNKIVFVERKKPHSNKSSFYSNECSTKPFFTIHLGLGEFMRVSAAEIISYLVVLVGHTLICPKGIAKLLKPRSTVNKGDTL